MFSIFKYKNISTEFDTDINAILIYKKITINLVILIRVATLPGNLEKSGI